MTEREFYERHIQMQKQMSLSRYQFLNKSARKNEIVLAGSSLCEQFPANEILISRGLTHTVYNRGVSGDTIDGLTLHLKTLVLDLCPRKLFINIGSNDIGGEQYNENLLFEKYIAVLSQIQNELPKCQIHVLAYYPVNPNADSILDEKVKAFMFLNRTNENIRKMNQRLKDHCNQHPYTFIDVHSILLDEQKQLQKNFTYDGIHLWPSAYEVVMDVLAPYFT